MAHPRPAHLSGATDRRIVFAFLIAISFAIGWIPLSHTELLAYQNDEYTQVLLVLPLSVALLFPALRSPLGKGWGLRAALPLLASSVVIAIGAPLAWRPMPPDIRLASQMLALVLSWIGIFLFCFGTKAARSALFPLLLLLVLVPLPEILLNPLITLLQAGSTWSAHALFAICGIPVLQKGFNLTIPGLSIQVAQECSSIRSSSMLLLTTVVLAQVFLRALWRKALVTAIALPLSVAKNGLRIFVLGFLGTRVDPSYLTGRLHHQGGILYFMIALACVFAAIWLCRRGEVGSQLGMRAGSTLQETSLNV